jgi:hypothetical protein
MSDQPISPEDVRKTIQTHAGRSGPTSFESRKWGAMIGWLNRYLVSDELRRLVLGWLFAFPGEKFEHMSSSKLTPQQKNGISKWIGTWFNDDLQEWQPRATFEQECIAVLNAARYDYHKVCGQLEMKIPFEVEGEPTGIVKEVIEDPLWNPESVEPEWCPECGEELLNGGDPCETCVYIGLQKSAPPPPPRRVTGVAL